jgi:hypothetical protein
MDKQALCALGLATVLAACGDDFTPYSKLDRLRVLAVAAEPPTPLPGQTTTVSALVFAPAGGSPSYHWTWCPAEAPASRQYQCALDPALAAQLFTPFLDPTVATLPPLDLGQQATATLTNPFSPGALAVLCATGLAGPGYAQSFDCDDGFPITVALEVATATESLRAGFVVRLPVGTAPELNLNPVPLGLALAGVPLDPPPPRMVAAPGQELELRVDIPTSALELRSIPAYEGPPGQRLERLTASWFADAGSLDADRTSFIEGKTSLADASTNRWTAPEAADWPADGRVEFGVVLRDDRGGVGWLLRHAVVEQAP